MATLQPSTCLCFHSLAYAELTGYYRHRGNLDRALDTYSNLASHYAPHTWASMESYMFSKALDTHNTLEKPRDSEWIHRILAFLKAYIDNAGAETLLACGDLSAYVGDLVEHPLLHATLDEGHQEG